MQALLVLLSIAALSLLVSSRALDAGRFPALARLAASGFLFLIFGVLVGRRWWGCSPRATWKTSAPWWRSVWAPRG
ncbi:hypothetical protein ACLESD_23525 [Pyxidicoccus sp. 3LFB2]